MIRNFLFAVLFLFGSVSLVAQNMTSHSGGIMYLKPMGGDGPTGLKRGSYVGPHVLGDTITVMLNNFEKAFVYFKQTSGAYPVEEKVVLKRAIYNKVKEFDDFIIENVKNATVSKTDAVARYKELLHTSTKLTRYETRPIEKEIKKLKSPVEFEQYLKKIVFQ